MEQAKDPERTEEPQDNMPEDNAEAAALGSFFYYFHLVSDPKRIPLSGVHFLPLFRRVCNQPVDVLHLYPCGIFCL